ncbi:MAG TPA: tripartite tricarboxylate transporter TctB family protein [Spirochaetia bacterium]|nr:tripartite tricarboxylate transporter TctB family protein [Spirochaetia bacterium]
MKKITSELLLGIIMLVIATSYLIMTFSIPRRGTIDATFVPFLLSGGMYLLGILQTIGALSKKKKKDVSSDNEKQEDSKEQVDVQTVLKTIGLIIIYIAFLDKIGFIIMSAVYLFAQFIVLTPVEKKKRYLVYAIIAVSSSVIIYIIFRYVFDLMLPGGLLS